MLTQRFDGHSPKWSKPQDATRFSTNRRIDNLHGLRNGNSVVNIPPPEKFRSGHLPRSTIPVSHIIPVDDETSSCSDMDESSDAEEVDVYGKYSVDSSPQDYIKGGRITNGALAAKDRIPASFGNQHYYSSDGFSDLGSSVDMSARLSHNSRKTSVASRYMEDGMSGLNSSIDVNHKQFQNLRKPISGGRYAEVENEDDKLSDSDGSSEFSSQGGREDSYSQAGRFSGAGRAGMVSTTRVDSEDYVGDSASMGSRNVKVGVNSWSMKNVESYSPRAPFEEDITEAGDTDGFSDSPTAPPIHCSGKEIRESEQEIVGKSLETHTECSNSNVATTTDGQAMPNQDTRNASSAEAAASSSLAPARVPVFHASGQGPWHSVIAYDACIRLCLHSWAKGCMEAPIFLNNECELLRSAFGLQHILLQPEEELLTKRSSEKANEGSGLKLKKIIGKMKIQVRKVRMTLDMPSGCSFTSLRASTVNLDLVRHQMSNFHSSLSSKWESLRNACIFPQLPGNNSVSKHRLSYMHASAQYIKQVSGLLKTGVTTLRNNSTYEIVQETYSCHLRLKSSLEEDSIPMQPGSGEAHVFFPDSLGDEMIVDVKESNGKYCGRAVIQVASIVENPNNKLRWWSIFREPEHELVGRIQLYINYTTSNDENGALKCGSVAETVAYDIVMEAAMKVQHVHQRNLMIHGSWKWLLAEFANYYGVSEAYSKLRYLSYVMDVATPTADCLTLVHDLLLPVILQSHSKNLLSHQENRILGEIEDQIEQILAIVFENYKSLNESLPSGIIDVFNQATGSPAPALNPAIKLYALLHDVLSPEAQLQLCSYFQSAAKKRARRHLLETDEYITNNAGRSMLDVICYSTAYQKMRTLCYNIRNEIFTDIEIHNQHILPSFVDLPNLAASIYSVELGNRLRAFLVACPPSGPSPPVADLIIATADFQKDLSSWNIRPVKGGVDAKELFHLYIILWIQDKRLALLEFCKSDKVKWSGARTQHMTTPLIDDMYDRLQDTLNEYEVIMCRWPEYTFVLENAIADVEKATVDALEKQYADVLTPLKDSMTTKKFGLKYVQKLAKRNSFTPYVVPDDLGTLLNTLKRLLDVLRPKVELRLKSWSSCIPAGGNVVAGEHLNEVTVALRAKFRNYLQAVIEKLMENTRAQNTTKLKKIIKDCKDVLVESDIRNRMQSLRNLLIETINQLHKVFEFQVFIAVCRGFWDRLGQDVLSFLENRKENRSWYKGARVTVTVLDDTFASQMQQLLGNALQEKDLEPPRSIMEVRSVLCKDVSVHKNSSFYY